MIGRFLLAQLAGQPLGGPVAPSVNTAGQSEPFGVGDRRGDTKELLASEWIHSACVVKAGV